MIRTFDSADGFLSASRPLLQEKEAENILILGIAANLSRDPHYYSDHDPIFITVHHQNNCVAACLQTPPKNLILYVDDKYKDYSISLLSQYLQNQRISIPGIVGPKESVKRFCDLWASLNSLCYEIQMEQFVYKLERLNPIPIAEGYLRRANDSDLSLMIDWTKAFYKEVELNVSFEEAERIAIKKVQEGAYYIWDNERAVSMAGWTRPTQKGVAIASVYTPHEYRKKGYASSCVAKLSALLLARYRFCTLFTDSSNSISNHMYQKMGYKMVDHVLQSKFTPQK